VTAKKTGSHGKFTHNNRGTVPCQDVITETSLEVGCKGVCEETIYILDRGFLVRDNRKMYNTFFYVMHFVVYVNYRVLYCHTTNVGLISVQ
jgi:hypothetical protein